MNKRRIIRRLLLRDVDTVVLYKMLNTLPEPLSIQPKLIEGHPVIIVRVTPDMIQQCFLHGESVHMSRRLLKLGELFKSKPEWRTSGFLGQLACCLYFYGDLRNFYQNLNVGHGDSGDLDIGNFKCDVKTRSMLYSGVNYIFIPEWQLENTPYPLYIGCSRTEENIIIWGYAWYREVLEWHKSNSNYQLDVTELHSIIQLKEGFKRALEHAKV